MHLYACMLSLGAVGYAMLRPTSCRPCCRIAVGILACTLLPPTPITESTGSVPTPITESTGSAPIVGCSGYLPSSAYHAMLMLFFFIMPAAMSGLGNLLLPIHLSTPEMLYPRVNNLGGILYSASVHVCSSRHSLCYLL